jgi:hypothetical protein
MTDLNLPTVSTQTQWKATLDAIASSVGETVYQLWFKDLYFLSLDDLVLEVGIPNRFFKDWINENYPDLIQTKFHEITDLQVSIKWTICATDAKAYAAQVHEEIYDAAAQQELKLSPLPTSMCRVSPFFPLSKNELINRKQMDNLVIGSGSWGVLTYSGPQLSIHDEDNLYGILGLIQKKKAASFVLLCYAKELLTFCNQNDSKGNYERLKKSLELMVNCKMTLTRPTGGSKKKKRSIKWDSSNILSFVGGDDATGKLKIIPNPYFYEMYLAKDYTLLDIQRRSKIKGLISKALYRFVMSHQYTAEPIPYTIETITQVLNLNDSLPLWKRRQQIEGAIVELIKEKILLKASRVDRDTNKVYLIKHPIKSKVGYIEEQKTA